MVEIKAVAENQKEKQSMYQGGYAQRERSDLLGESQLQILNETAQRSLNSLDRMPTIVSLRRLEVVGSLNLVH
jgi:hypothetical protein